jgi:hypothetical protein
MLVMTSPANAKMQAFWHNPLRRWFQYLDQFSTHVTALLIHAVDEDRFAGQGKGNKNGAPIGESSEGIAAEGQLFQFNGQQVGGHGGRREEISLVNF